MQNLYTVMHKFDKMFQNKYIIIKIFVFEYAQINLRKRQKILAFFNLYLKNFLCVCFKKNVVFFEMGV